MIEIPSSMIEEMAKEIREMQPIFYGNIAEMLYNAGYRKIPEGAVVLTREDFKAYSFVKEFFDGKSTKITAGELVRALQLYGKQARKETAERFAERLKERLDISVDGYSTSEVMSKIEDQIDEIAKEITEGWLYVDIII